MCGRFELATLFPLLSGWGILQSTPVYSLARVWPTTTKVLSDLSFAARRAKKKVACWGPKNREDSMQPKSAVVSHTAANLERRISLLHEGGLWESSGALPRRSFKVRS